MFLGFSNNTTPPLSIWWFSKSRSQLVLWLVGPLERGFVQPGWSAVLSLDGVLFSALGSLNLICTHPWMTGREIPTHSAIIPDVRNLSRSHIQNLVFDRMWQWKEGSIVQDSEVKITEVSNPESPGNLRGNSGWKDSRGEKSLGTWSAGLSAGKRSQAAEETPVLCKGSAAANDKHWLLCLWCPPSMPSTVLTTLPNDPVGSVLLTPAEEVGERGWIICSVS